jgi:hypothetical protein
MRGARGWLAPAPRNETASSRAQQTMGQDQLFTGPGPRSPNCATPFRMSQPACGGVLLARLRSRSSW